MTGRRLPNRRPSETFACVWANMNFAATISRFDNGRLAEAFIGNHQIVSPADIAAKDSAVVASIALQFSPDLATLRKALLRPPGGATSGPVGPDMTDDGGGA